LETSRIILGTAGLLYLCAGHAFKTFLVNEMLSDKYDKSFTRHDLFVKDMGVYGYQNSKPVAFMFDLTIMLIWPVMVTFVVINRIRRNLKRGAR
jgi:hypothetical protein